MDDPFDLNRFVAAQDGIYPAALSEIRAGAKRSHWMWFVFPQLIGLGSSDMARRFAIRTQDETCAYLQHDLLGKRYRECVAALAALPTPDAGDVFGPVDAVKLRSSLTLFAITDESAPIRAELARWFGTPDPVTVRLLADPAC